MYCPMLVLMTRVLRFTVLIGPGGGWRMVASAPGHLPSQDLDLSSLGT